MLQNLTRAGGFLFGRHTYELFAACLRDAVGLAGTSLGDAVGLGTQWAWGRSGPEDLTRADCVPPEPG